jgi:hypothetical protein
MSGTDEWFEETRRTRADIAARWLPSFEARQVAAAMLAAAPGAEAVIVAMIQPGKTRGVWTRGQEVATVPGAFFLAAREGESGDGLTDYATARALAENIGEMALVERAVARRAVSGEPAPAGEAGTVAYAVIYADGPPDVFEC